MTMILDDPQMTMIALAAGALLGGVLLGWLVARTRVETARVEGRAGADVELAALQERVRSLEAVCEREAAGAAALRQGLEAARAELAAARDELARVEERAARLPTLEQELVRLRAEAEGLRGELAGATTRLEAERRQAEEKLALLGEARERLTEQFKNLAAEILEDKSRRFTELNLTNLGQLLDPLRQRIGEFQARVEQVYDTEGKQRSVLADQVRRLFELNQQLSKDANDLTRALKGSAKAQGNWGELILERVLEISGLRRGEEYELQESHLREDGTRAQPDVVIRMPEDRHLVIDAKVSLTAYEEYAAAEDEAEREAALRRHLDSVRAHIRGLAERNYQDLHGLGSLDFVLMFVAVEPAFMLAVTHDRELFQHAWDRNVLLVSPSTLLFVVRTVAHLWRQDAQNRNALEIARRGAELYDKLVLFIESLEMLGQRLRQAQDEFDQARNRLTGRGGAVRQAEMLLELGVKAKKKLPAAVAAALEEGAPEPVAAAAPEAASAAEVTADPQDSAAQ